MLNVILPTAARELPLSGDAEGRAAVLLDALRGLELAVSQAFPEIGFSPVPSTLRPLQAQIIEARFAIAAEGRAL